MIGFENITPDYLEILLHLLFSGSCQCYCPRRWPELWLCLEQRHPPSGRRRRSLHQTGWWKSPRRQQQQVQHFLGLHPLRRLRTGRVRQKEKHQSTVGRGYVFKAGMLSSFPIAPSSWTPLLHISQTKHPGSLAESGRKAPEDRLRGARQEA